LVAADWKLTEWQYLLSPFLAEKVSRMSSKSIVMAGIVLAVTTSSSAQEPQFKSEVARNVWSEYEAAIQKVNAEFAAKFKAAAVDAIQAGEADDATKLVRASKDLPLATVSVDSLACAALTGRLEGTTWDAGPPYLTRFLPQMKVQSVASGNIANWVATDANTAIVGGRLASSSLYIWKFNEDFTRAHMMRLLPDSKNDKQARKSTK
jgi:hypothetical protein